MEVEPDRKLGQFPPGVSGNPAGRPKGARHRMSEDLIESLATDFAEHGAKAIVAVRETDPAAYLRVIAGLVPKELMLDTREGVRLGVVILPPKGGH